MNKTWIICTKSKLELQHHDFYLQCWIVYILDSESHIRLKISQNRYRIQVQTLHRYNSSIISRLEQIPPLYTSLNTKFASPIFAEWIELKISPALPNEFSGKIRAWCDFSLLLNYHIPEVLWKSYRPSLRFFVILRHGQSFFPIVRTFRYKSHTKNEVGWSKKLENLICLGE